MKISDAIKAKLAGTSTIILGLWWSAFPVYEIYSRKIEILGKYGGGQIFASKEPRYFWTRIFLSCSAV